MELQRSAVQSFRQSLKRTKAISIELSSIMKSQVDCLINLDSLTCNPISSKLTSINTYSDKHKPIEAKTETEQLFEFQVPEKLQDYISETRLLMNDVN